MRRRTVEQPTIKGELRILEPWTITVSIRVDSIDPDTVTLTARGIGSRALTLGDTLTIDLTVDDLGPKART